MKVKIKYILPLIGLFILFSCDAKHDKKIYMETINENGRWGYEIFINNKRYIHQEVIPAVAGNKYFASEREAELVGKLVLRKMMNKETPTVNTGELKQLGIKGTS